MTTRCLSLMTMIGLLMTGCANKSAGDSQGDAVPPAAGEQPASEQPAGSTDAERPPLTTAECEAKSGRVVGDIGDGAIHRPDYTCEGGQKPLGTIKPGEGEPVAIEGSVCCPNPA
ncbi:MAG TPA: hypothetical protein VGB85_10190 [Nannocystis sp.]